MLATPENLSMKTRCLRHLALSIIEARFPAKHSLSATAQYVYAICKCTAPEATYDDVFSRDVTDECTVLFMKIVSNFRRH
jgi:hypothetical protein